MSTMEGTEEASILMKVAQQVASTTGQGITQLPPLYDSIDSEALDSLIKSAGTSSSLEI